MKLSDYAKKVGVKYRTAWEWYKAGKIEGYQMDTGTIIITESETSHVAEVIYTVQPDVSYDLDYDIVSGIDIGLSNLATVTSNKQGFQSLVINGVSHSSR